MGRGGDRPGLVRTQPDRHRLRPRTGVVGQVHDAVPLKEPGGLALAAASAEKGVEAVTPEHPLWRAAQRALHDVASINLMALLVSLSAGRVHPVNTLCNGWSTALRRCAAVRAYEALRRASPSCVRSCCTGASVT